MKRRIGLKDIYIIISVAVALIIMAVCYLHFDTVNGIIKFIPKTPGKEWWAITSLLFMSLFMSKVIPQDKVRFTQHACGITIITLFMLGGVFEYLCINPGTQFWTLIGSTLGVWIGAGNTGGV